jgi:hypothetical protein
MLRILIISTLVHLLVTLVAAGGLWWLSSGLPLAWRVGMLVAFALGVIHSKLRKWVSSSETARLSRKSQNGSQP